MRLSILNVSVIIPTYNSGLLAVEAVASVLAQTEQAYEIIVVDDGSADDTAERMATFGTAVKYIRKENGGVSSARNRGVAEATGDFIAFLDADDVWHPNKLELQLAAIGSRPDLGLLATGTFPWPGPSPAPVETTELISPVEIGFEDLLLRNVFTASSVMVRSETLAAAGAFDTNQSGTEDYDLWLRIARCAKVAQLTTALTGYRIATPGSLSKNAVRMEAGMRIILGKLEAAGVFRNKPLLRRKVWGYLRYSCGFMHHQAGNRRAAIFLAAGSILSYPLPYRREEVRYRFGRVRLLAASLRARKAL